LPLFVIGASAAGAAELKPSWNYVGGTSGILVSSRYVFVDRPYAYDGSIAPGGRLIDDLTRRRVLIVPPVPAGFSCSPGAAALGGPWVAFLCFEPSATSSYPTDRIELYRIATRQWRVLPAPIPNAHIQAVGADWIEYWAPDLPGKYPQFVFQNIYTGQTRTLAGWHAGGRIVPDLNSRALGKRLCAPLRVPDAWEDTGVTEQAFPGTVSFFGRYAVVGGFNRDVPGVAYLERCGTSTHSRIGPLGPLGESGPASANAIVWPTSSNAHGVYLPSLKRFTVDTSGPVNAVVSGYTGPPNTYSIWPTARSLYLLVIPYTPTCDPTQQCTPDPSPQLYRARAPT
jgi:hypothetical protein